MGMPIVPIANLTGQAVVLGTGPGKPQAAATNRQPSTVDQDVARFLEAKEKELAGIQSNNDLQPPEKSLLQWIFSRDLGRPNANAHLEAALNNWGTRKQVAMDPVARTRTLSTWGVGESGAKNWRAKLALLLINEIANATDLARLTDQNKPFKLNVTIPSGATNDQIKLILLQSNDLKKILQETNDPLLWGDYYSQLGQVTQKTGGNGAPHFTRAILEYAKVENPTYIDSINNRVQNKTTASALYNSDALPDALAGQAKAKLMLAITEAKGDSARASTLRHEAQALFIRAKQTILNACGSDQQKLLNKKFQLMDIDSFQADIAFQDNRLNDVVALTETNFRWGEAYFSDQNRRRHGSAWLKQITGTCGYWGGKAYQTKALATGLSLPVRIAHLTSAANLFEPALPYLNGALLNETQRIIGDNLLLRAYATRSLGNSSWKALFSKAEDHFNGLLATAAPQDKAEIQATLAKILLIESEYKPNALAEADKQVKQAISSGLLLGNKLTTAHETQGNIYIAQKKLTEAEASLREAIRLDAANYSATVLLGDVLNWRGEFTAAKSEYEKIPAGHEVYLHARLGLLELAARQNPAEVLENTSIELIGKVMAGGPTNSFLVPRALELMSEAFLANKSSQEQIIHLGNLLLGTTFKTTAERGGLITTLAINLEQKKVSAANLSRVFKANLLLKLAQVLSWGNRFNDAEKALTQGRRDFKAEIDGDKNINIRYDLTAAIVKMRKNQKEATHPNDIYVAATRVFTEKPDDTDLVLEAIRALLEQFQIEKRADKIILLSDHLVGLNLYTGRQTPDELSNYFESAAIPGLSRTKAELNQTLGNLSTQELERSFQARGQQHAFDALKCDLTLAMIDALAWTSKYAAAVKLGENLKANPSFQNKSTLIKATVYGSLGDMYRYGAKNPVKSREHYTLVIAQINTVQESARSDRHLTLLARGYLGLAHLCFEEEGNPIGARQNLEQAEIFARKVKDDEILKEIILLRSKLNGANIIIGNETFYDSNSRLERRTGATFQYSFLNGYLVPQVRYQLDQAEGLAIHSGYLGVALRLIGGNPHYLNLEARAKVAEHAAYGQPGATMRYYRQPDATFSGATNFGTKAVSLAGTANLFFGESDYNSYYGQFVISPNRFIGLGVEGNRYMFNYTGEARRRFEGNGLVRVSADLGDLGLAPYNRANLRAFVGYPYYQLAHVEDKTNPAFNPSSVKVGLGTEVNVGAGVTLNAGWSYQRQFAYQGQPDYHYQLINFGGQW